VVSSSSSTSNYHQQQKQSSSLDNQQGKQRHQQYSIRAGSGVHDHAREGAHDGEGGVAAELGSRRRGGPAGGGWRARAMAAMAAPFAGH